MSLEYYSSFMDSNMNVKNPQEFEKLKKDLRFVEYLSKKISKDMSENLDVEAELIAKKILQFSQNDIKFSMNISDKIKEINSNYSHGTKTSVDKIIRRSGLLIPSGIYKSKQVNSKEDPKPIGYVRRAPRSIIPDSEKQTVTPLVNDMVKAIITNQPGHFTKPVTEVLAFLHGERSLDSLGITNENSREYLKAVKLWDHAMALANYQTNKHDSFAVSSYSLRTKIAEIGKLSSHEVYIKTLDPVQFENWDFLEKQSNWHPERAKVHAKIIEINLVKAIDLSRRLNTEKPSVWAVRGNTGAGKTYTISKDAQFRSALDEKQDSSGAINPDTFKGILRKETSGLSHAQLHKEGSALSFQFASSLAKEAVHATMLIDMRLAKHSYVKAEVIDPANIRHGEARIIDIETPIITSINRVLLRSPDGIDPIVPLDSIRQGYEDIKEEREKVLNEVMTNDTITYFKLYINDENGEQKLALKKENGKFEIMPGMEAAVKNAQKKPTEVELNALFDQVIDEEYINQAKTRDHISDSKIGMIEKWKGYTVREALQRHATG